MKALVLFSGGIDSTTALGLAIKKYGKDQVTALMDRNMIRKLRQQQRSRNIMV